MAKRSKKLDSQSISDYRHEHKRKNIPPAGLAAQGKVREVPKTRLFYDPHLPPVLRFDPTGEADRLPELLETARQRPLTAEEAQVLADALRNRQPWLEWAGKREKEWFEVDPVALHIHERVSTQAILKLAQREPMQRSLFADPELEYRQAIQFYQHDVDWANRLILGDSLTVMHSLAQREDLAGKVQMIYIDPPYGIKFASNFQSIISSRVVKDKEEDISREIEQIKAYRDTWTLGVHTYLNYLRERILLARELISDTGSIFVQISKDNLHRVELLLDEIFGNENKIALISYITTGSQTSDFLPATTDHLLWYCKNKEKIKAKKYYIPRSENDELPDTLSWYSQKKENGEIRRLLSQELRSVAKLEVVEKPFWLADLLSRSGGASTQYRIELEGRSAVPHRGGWRTSSDGMKRILRSERLQWKGDVILFRRYKDDFWFSDLTTLWLDTQQGGFRESDKVYVVQTNTKVIERCLLMTTDPGDLVLDPTCGSGTTAYVAEQWGRRWIAIDTSRVAVALARKRLLTAKYNYYELADESIGISSGFTYKTVPHITLKSIAQNQALDPIFAQYEPLLVQKLEGLNRALAGVAPQIRTKLAAKYAEKERREGKSSLTEADRRRWLLPQNEWKEWEAPFDSDPDWPEELKQALDAYRKTWREKMDAVNATIAASAPQETLYDKPQVVPGVVRVSGPFTVEGVQPLEETIEMESPITGEPEELETFAEEDATNAEAYLEKMIRLLKQDGVRFPDNKVVTFGRLDPLPNSILHAEGEWGTNGSARRVAVSFGPQYGPLTAKQVEECLHVAARRGYEDLVFAAFAIDGSAQAIIQDDPNPMVRVHMANIRPDVQMGDLLKDTPGSQLFTVFGLPRVQLTRSAGEEWCVEMEGVDIYDPVNNTLSATGADKVAAWFLDSDYDGSTFCISQAFFPDKSAWDKIAKALKTTVDPERFAAFSGTTSLPFPAGKHQRIAVKVIDPRGNEVMRVMALEQ